MSVSAIIPAYREPYLQKTVDDILSKSIGEIEVIVFLDGWWPDPPLKEDKRVKIIHAGEPVGMRHAINSAAIMARNENLLKCDAHCMFDGGFDEILKADMMPNWTVVPVRYPLDPEQWKPDHRKRYEFEYIASEDLKGRKWPEYAERVKGRSLPELMSFQGSCWFMRRERFYELGMLDEIHYGGMGREAQEISLKTWLSGGRCVLNRKTWYAHWSKGKADITRSGSENRQKSADYAVDFWKNDKWDKAEHSLQWLVDKFAPVPTWDSGAGLNPAPYDPEPDAVCECRGGFNTRPQQKAGVKVWPFKSRDEIYKMFADRGYATGAEIGVYKGINAENMLNAIPGLKLFLVDPLKDYDLGRIQRGEKKFEKLKRHIAERTQGRDVELIEQMSEDAVKHIPDNFLDFVYIDGNHSYDFAMLDILLWSRKVRAGGMVSGHDYYNDPAHSVGVRSAVDDYVRQHNLALNITEKIRDPGTRSRVRSWWWVK